MTIAANEASVKDVFAMASAKTGSLALASAIADRTSFDGTLHRAVNSALASSSTDSTAPFGGMTGTPSSDISGMSKE